MWLQMLRYPAIPSEQLSNDAGDEDNVDSSTRERRLIEDEALSGLSEEDRNRLKYIQKRRYVDIIGSAVARLIRAAVWWRQCRSDGCTFSPSISVSVGLTNVVRNTACRFNNLLDGRRLYFTHVSSGSQRWTRLRRTPVD